MFDDLGFRVTKATPDIQEFRPEFRVYVIRIVIIAAAWAVPLAAGTVYSTIVSLLGGDIIVPLLLLVPATLGTFLVSLLYMYLFNELAGWGRAKTALWELHPDRLVLTNDDGMQSLPLQNIASAHRHFWWSVRFRLINGQAVLMEYIPNNADVVAIFRTAISAAKQGGET